MNGFTLTRSAKDDLRAIAVFTEERWGRDQRNLYIKQFDEAFHMLAGVPMAGKACDDIRSGYRRYPQGSHVIFYRCGRAGSIEVVRILHKQMDIESKLLGS